VKSPTEIDAEIKRLEVLRDRLREQNPERNVIYQRFDAKIDALKWVLSEKP